MDSILKFLENKTILVTGAAGFLSKIMVEKILRTQPNVKKLYLLLRAPDKESAHLRLQMEIIGKDLFKVLKEKKGRNFCNFIEEKLVMVPGDITWEDLAIQESSLKQELCNDLDVIVNMAANTNFDERYDISLNLNCFGAKHVLDFAKKCTKLKVLVHVSTAYVSGERGGLISESPYNLGETLNGKAGLDVENEKRLLVEKLTQLHSEKATDDTIKSTMKDMGIKRARTYGWPNVYVFTKALGEMLITEYKEHVPTVIVRPTIVTSTCKEPFPGWAEGIRTIDSLITAYAKGRLTFFLGDPEAVTDVIPGDLVINAILVAMMAHANQFGADAKIYHVGSSVSNPIRFSLIQEISYQYFSKHPWTGRDGKPIVVGRVKLLSSMESFNEYLAINYILPLKCLQIVNTAFCKYFNGLYSDLNRKVNIVQRLIDIYAPYLFFKATYDDTNTKILRQKARDQLDGEESDMFSFDPKDIDWADYFMYTHLPGIVKYIFK